MLSIFNLFKTLTILTLSGTLNHVSGTPINLPRDTFLEKRTGTATCPYTEDKIRGVNLGGWFVLEPFINTNLWSQFTDASNIPVDEWHFSEYLGKQETITQLQKHWDTWITYDDLCEIKQSGLNHVRIPLGYWAFQNFNNEPYVQGQLPYLTRALGWIKDLGLKCWIDIHGAPGSQNGFDNSGLRDSYKWQDDDNVKNTLIVLQQLADFVANGNWVDIVTAIELINEPLGPILNIDSLKSDFYQPGYNLVRYRPDGSLTTIPVAFHDAFLTPTKWNDYLPNFQNSYLDHHSYQVFDAGQVSWSIQGHIAATCNLGVSLLDVGMPIVVGEWSPALTDCAPLLNGVYLGSRYDGTWKDITNATGTCADKTTVQNFSDEYKINLRKYTEAQMDAYELDSNCGWIMWAWKTDSADEWSFKALLRAGLIPQPLTQRTYPNQCGYH